MKYIVHYYAEGEKEWNRYDVIMSEEALVYFIQQKRFDEKGMKYPAKNFKINPFIPENCMLFNKATCETRIVKSIDYISGTVEVYNTDAPPLAEQQKLGYIPTLPEEWKIEDCVVVDMDRLMHKYDFNFGSKTGQQPQFAQLFMNGYCVLT